MPLASDDDCVWAPLQAIEMVLKPYQDAYKDSKDRTVLPRIITTGHSLGGALAVIAAVSIQHMFPAYQARPSLIDLLCCTPGRCQ
jgi:acetyl esterase/lipase